MTTPPSVPGRAVLFLLAAALTILLPSPLSGQARLTGQVLSAGDGSPVTGAFVSLETPDGNRADATLTDDTGRFTLEAPTSGRYRVFVRRMGYDRWRSPVLGLDQGAGVHRVFRVPVRPVELDDLSVTAESQCDFDPRATGDIQRLWRAVRQGLDVAAWSERRFSFDLRNRRRLLDPDGTERRVIATWSQAGVEGPPYRSREPERLSEEGFIQERGGSLYFYAPTPRTLLSESFRATHCFSVRRDSAGRPGLHFRPADDGDDSDVRGTLWLEGSPPRLHSLRYRYTRLPVDVPREHLGGRLEFDRLQGGAWIVRRWWIRMPRAEVAVPESPSTMIRSSTLDREARLRAIVERGGEVVGVSGPPSDSAEGGGVEEGPRGDRDEAGREAVVRSGGRRPALPAAPAKTGALRIPNVGLTSDSVERSVRVVGRVVDLNTGEPVPSAVVRVPTAGVRTTTGDDGRFELAGVPPGERILRFRHVRYGDQGTAVDLPQSRAVSLTVRLPPRAIEVEDVEVTVDVRSPSLEGTGFYERRKWGRKLERGTFLTSEEIRNRGARVTHVLGTVPGVAARRGLVAFERYRLGLDGTCLPALYLDGHRVIGSSTDVFSYRNSLGKNGINTLVSPVEIAGIEIYDSPASTAGHFQDSDSRCGVIAIWTK